MSTYRRAVLRGLAAGGLVGLAGCGSVLGGRTENPGVAGETLTVTTTTSAYDTGLLDHLNRPFQQRYDVTVEAIAQGTGRALRTARDGDADAVIAHARSLEDEFLRDGYGVNRRDLMFNDFVVVGPPSDPAGITGIDAPSAAFAAIARANAPFVSRADDSGTHAKEREIWAESAVDPGGDWYREIGQGMGQTLNVASESGSYTLSDRGTFLARRDATDLEIVVQGPVEGGPEILANPYGIIAVNPAVHDHVNYDLAMAYIGFLTGPRGQERIANYRRNGEQLFYPRALSADPDFRQYVPEGWRAGTESG